jgi:hypothetical protein
MAVESFSFLFVSCDLVTFFGSARIAVIAGLFPFVVDAEAAGAAQRAIRFADRLALLIVCLIFAHLRPVFYAPISAYELSRSFSDAAKIVWRAHATILFGGSMVAAAFFALGSILIFAKMTTAHFNSSD